MTLDHVGAFTCNCCGQVSISKTHVTPGVTRYREIGGLKNSEVNKQMRDKLGSVCFHLYFIVKTPSETTGAVGH